MNELNNTVSAVGDYNSIPTSITSNTSVVNIVEGLSITKTADKQNWSGGELTYTVEIKNDAESAYENPKVIDIIDTTLVDFVKGSVTINGKKAEESEYSYVEDTHTLTINLSTINPSSSTTLSFQVTKKA